MEEKLTTPDEMIRQAERLYLDAAFMLVPRMQTKMRKAVKLVILDRVPVAIAAARVRRPRQHVYRALARVRPKLELVKKPAE